MSQVSMIPDIPHFPETNTYLSGDDATRLVENDPAPLLPDEELVPSDPPNEADTAKAARMFRARHDTLAPVRTVDSRADFLQH